MCVKTVGSYTLRYAVPQVGGKSSRNPFRIRGLGTQGKRNHTHPDGLLQVIRTRPPNA